MEGKFTFRKSSKTYARSLKIVRIKKNATSTRFMVQNIPVCSFDNISPISKTRIDKLVNKTE